MLVSRMSYFLKSRTVYMSGLSPDSHPHTLRYACSVTSVTRGNFKYSKVQHFPKAVK